MATQTQVSCGGYCASYTGGPKVEARNPIATPNPNTKTVAQTIQRVCVGYSANGTGVPTVPAGALIARDTVIKLQYAINQELQRRSMSNSSFTPVYVDQICYPNIISEINNAIYRMRAFSATNPTTGNIMTASTDINPAIQTLNALVAECICYTDCRGYSVCYCHGYCNNY